MGKLLNINLIDQDKININQELDKFREIISKNSLDNQFSEILPEIKIKSFGNQAHQKLIRKIKKEGNKKEVLSILNQYETKRLKLIRFKNELVKNSIINKSDEKETFEFFIELVYELKETAVEKPNPTKPLSHYLRNIQLSDFEKKINNYKFNDEWKFPKNFLVKLVRHLIDAKLFKFETDQKEKNILLARIFQRHFNIKVGHIIFPYQEFARMDEQEISDNHLKKIKTIFNQTDKS